MIELTFARDQLDRCSRCRTECQANRAEDSTKNFLLMVLNLLLLLYSIVVVLGSVLWDMRHWMHNISPVLLYLQNQTGESLLSLKVRSISSLTPIDAERESSWRRVITWEGYCRWEMCWLGDNKYWLMSVLRSRWTFLDGSKLK